LIVLRATLETGLNCLDSEVVMMSQRTLSRWLSALVVVGVGCTQAADRSIGPTDTTEPIDPVGTSSFDLPDIPDLGDAKVYSLDANTNVLRTIDPATGLTIKTAAVLVDGLPIIGGNGLATHPRTNELYALVRLPIQATRELVTIDPASGVATRIGDTGDRFASLAFSCKGTLFGVTGRSPGGPFPTEFLFELDPRGIAPPAPLFSLSDGSRDYGGRALAFNIDDGLMYYLTTKEEATALFAVDLVTTELRRIGLDDNFSSPLSATFVSENTMLAASTFSELATITIDGHMSDRVFFGHRVKGLALVPSLCESVVEVLIDIKPGSDPNSVNTKKKGRLPVAILTTDEFDAATVNAATITIGDGEGDETPVAARKNGTLTAELEDVDDDGDLDMILHFETQAIVAAGDLHEGTTSLIVNGFTTDDVALAGTDAVRVVK
jgi:hypothetical protein